MSFFSVCQVVVKEGGLVSGLSLCGLYFTIRSKIGLYISVYVVHLLLLLLFFVCSLSRATSDLSVELRYA